MVCGQHVNIHLRSDSSGAIGVKSRRGLQRLRHLDVRFLWLQVETASKNIRISKVPGPEKVADANTKPADKRSLEFCRSKMGVTEIPKQFRDAVTSSSQSSCLCVIVHGHVCSTSLQVLQVNVMSNNPDSENVNRLWSGRPQPSGDANITRCLWCFTLLMNLHDFVTESFNPEHIFHNAHTVPFCLTADHIATCHMSLCPHQARFGEGAKLAEHVARDLKQHMTGIFLAIEHTAKFLLT